MKSRNPLLMAIAFSLFILNGSGCAFKKDDPKKVTSATPTAEDVADELERKRTEQLQQETISSSDFVFEINEDAQENSYLITISYPEKEGVRVSIDFNNEPIEELKSGTTISALGGTLAQFKIIAYNSNGVIILSTIKKILVPKDLGITGTVSLEEDTTWKLGRLYLHDNSTLKTNGFLLSIEANRIIAKPDSRIINFEPKNVWVTAAQQRGGSISIRSKYASGLLIVNLNGANGQHGRSGAELESLNMAQNAHDGYPGEDGDWGGDEDCTEDRYSGQTRCGIINLRCISQPTNGEDGEDGPDGANGENGSDGGDTGNLFVQIEDHTNFALKLSIRPGQGGLGGQGTPGKMGGKGGKAGALDQQKVCKPASKGKDGSPGKPGRNGENGQPGKVGTIELNGLKNAIIE